MLGHLDPAFHAVLDEVTAMLRAVWRMPDGDVFALPSTGTSAMEAGLLNLLDPGDTAIVAEAGSSAAAGRDGGAPRRPRRARHGALGPDGAERGAARRARRPSRTRPVAVVHAETSTGALHPLRELATALFGSTCC